MFARRTSLRQNPLTQAALIHPNLSWTRQTATRSLFPRSLTTTAHLKMASNEQPKVKADAEKNIKRNPHPDFKKVESSRPDFDSNRGFAFTKTPKPDWKLGDGANDGGECLKKEHICIDPYEKDRPAASNYKLLISAIVPRPIGFLSTRSADGSSTNLAPFSYMNVVNHDPPIFIVGFAGGWDNAKDTISNLQGTREATLNIISEHFIEAANSTSVNAPYGTSEWVLSGLTPAPCQEVKASRVKEAVFSVEVKLVETKEFESRANPGKKNGILAIMEGVRFWVRDDAINADRNLIDPNVLRPLSRLGGITYARVVDGFEIPRPDFNESIKADKHAEDALVKPKADGQ